MSKPMIRDVYFWSETTGLLSFPGAEFHPGDEDAADDDRLLSIEARVEDTFDIRPLVHAHYVCGLLWAADPADGALQLYPGNRIHEMVPAILWGSKSDPRVDPGRWIHVEWKPSAPFLAKNFLRHATP